MAYGSYVKSLLVDVDSVQRLTGRKELTTSDRNKLNSIAKLIEFGVGNKGYGDDKSYLSALNPHISDIHEQFKLDMDPRSP
jgi:hypothetical protein